MKIAINQPCYLPWRGYLALIRMVDVFVFYDDVALPKGGGAGRGFQTRVQVKMETGKHWLSVPIDRSGQAVPVICGAFIDETTDWRHSHLGRLDHAFQRAPHWAELRPEVAAWLSRPWSSLGELTVTTTRELVRMLGIETQTLRSSELDIHGSKTERLVRICQHFGATSYISPQGSVAYLDHGLFADQGIDVEYADYDVGPYPQQFGAFDPYVTVLDVLANVGRNEARGFIGATTIPWHEMVARSRMGQSKEQDD